VNTELRVDKFQKRSQEEKKLDELQIYIKPVEETLYSATVSIKKRVDKFGKWSQEKKETVKLQKKETRSKACGPLICLPSSSVNLTTIARKRWSPPPSADGARGETSIPNSSESTTRSW